jgi:signal transduction histidine kinase/CheY-like chemotaxis protein
MDERASAVQEDVLRLLIISLTIWFVSIILAILGYLLSNEIAKNIKNLEDVLKRVAEDTKDTHDHDIDVNLHSADGTAEAYKLLETIIEQTREDKISAQEASEAKSMFLANMSHEIRTPLNGIVGFTELLKDTGLEEEQSEFVEIIEKSSENLLEIINNILDLSKIESNKLEIEDIIFNPVEEFESAVEVYAVRASEKHIDLGCFIDPELEQPLKGDPTKIKEVVINLLSNAVKFTSSSGAINVNIRKLETEMDGITRVRFEVQDSGIGVTSEQKARIFEAFSQADTSITRKYGGTGLGLTISSRFIELMGGQLDLHSEPGEGTTFFFTIDFEEVETLNETSKGNFSGINALVLEDAHKSKKQGTYLREYLDFYGVSYTTFKDEDELKLLQSQVDYDLMFIDYDYCSESTLVTYGNQPQEVVLLTKSTYMKKIESSNIDIFKSLYEPLNNSKIKLLLDTYQSQNFKAKKSKKISRKKFDAATSKFDANVLIAEDNIINQKLIKRTLEDIGLNVTIANNGLEAFQKRKDGNYDLMFMDIQMPFLDGVEATKEILDYEEDYNQPHIPIIALTANALKGDRERFLEAGLDEYTTKPLVRDEIISLLNHFLADHIVESTEVPKSADDITTEEAESFADETEETSLLEPTETITEELDSEQPGDEVENIEEVNTEELTAEQPSDEVETVEETQQEVISEKPKYTADILLAKKSLFESKLYIQILESLGYTYDVAHNQEEIDKAIENSTYKVILFDKECEELELSEFSKNVKVSNEDTGLVTYLILISDPMTEEDPDDVLYVHEIIKNVVNKDLLRLVFEKFI